MALTTGLGSAWSAIVTAKASIITGVCVAAVCLPLGYCKGEEAARAKADAERSLANVAAMTTAKTADDAAATERVADALENAEHEQELTDAIADTPDTAPDPVRVRLGCERLRQAGTPEADIPSVCRSSGGDGSKAPAHS